MPPLSTRAWRAADFPRADVELTKPKRAQQAASRLFMRPLGFVHKDSLQIARLFREIYSRANRENN